MCHNGKHDLDKVGTAPRTRRKNGRDLTYQSCKGCAADRHRRYDQSWRGQDRRERVKAKQREKNNGTEPAEERAHSSAR